MSPIPSPPDRRRLAARANMPEKTCVRAYREPHKCKPSTVDRVRLAAEALGLPPPATASPDQGAP